MTRTSSSTGACLCGGVRIAAADRSDSVGACHCGMCRKWTGGPMLGVDCGTEVTISGADLLSVYPSSDWAERGFCARCGSHLFYRLTDDGRYIVPPGVFDDDRRLRLDHQVFIDDKPAYYSFAEQTHDMTGREVFERYSSPTGGD